MPRHPASEAPPTNPIRIPGPIPGAQEIQHPVKRALRAVAITALAAVVVVPAMWVALLVCIQVVGR